ncbi:MAG: DUF2955 domain-containing protein [Vibrio sp.]
MLLRDHAMSANGYRQCLRIAIATTIAFFIAKIFNLTNPIFYVINPMLLLGLAPVLNGFVARQMLGASIACGLQVGILAGLFGDKPVLMIPIVFICFMAYFRCMSIGALFLFGSNGVVNSSIMLHFASYSNVNMNVLIMDNIMGVALSLVLAGVVYALLPDVEPRVKPTPVAKNINRMRHETLLGASVATLSYCVFQVFDLQGSMSAQATSLLLLFPMNWDGMLAYGRKRAIGTLLGVSYGILAQLLLYDWSSQLVLVLPLFWLGVMLFSHIHVTEAAGSGVGFSAMSSLGVLFGQYLQPNSDLIYSALYRFSSICFAITCTLMVCYIVHRLLNQFQATRFGA